MIDQNEFNGLRDEMINVLWIDREILTIYASRSDLHVIDVAKLTYENYLKYPEVKWMNKHVELKEALSDAFCLQAPVEQKSQFQFCSY